MLGMRVPFVASAQQQHNTKKCVLISKDTLIFVRALCSIKTESHILYICVCEFEIRQSVQFSRCV